MVLMMSVAEIRSKPNHFLEPAFKDETHLGETLGISMSKGQ